MNKIRLELDSIRVESFSTVEEKGRSRGTVRGLAVTYQLEDTCQVSSSCLDNMCTVDCTGFGLFCHTNDPGYVYDCTAAPCSDGPVCTNTTCTENNETCQGCTV